ncbi:MAG: glycosyltransferase family 39 protein [Burkholderiales bacterium]|nr:glycosyltransferase family 39 protein [Burkholderiales bacterium]
MHNAIKPNHVFWIFALIALVWFSNLEYRKLVRPDEGRYAEIPREMVVSGDWITPRLNGIKYFEKPALQYWMTAAAYEIFGERQWTARLWSGLTGFLGIVLIYLTGRLLFGPDAGFYSALVLASSLLYAVIGHLNTLDMGVTFFMCLSMCGFLLAQATASTPGARKLWMHAAWAAMGFSILSKGLIGIVLPGAVLVIYTLVQRDWGIWKRLNLFSGIPLMLLISAPWFFAVSRANPEFFHFFFIHEHFERFLTKDHGRYHPWSYFIPILLAGILPWVVTLFEALIHAWKPQESKFQPGRFLFIWIVFIYAFFSFSDSKLPSYILPIFPALALLIGQRLASMTGNRLFWHILPTAILGAIGLALSPQVVRFADPIVPQTLYENYVPWLAAAATTALIGALYALYMSRHGKNEGAIVALSLSILVSGQLIMAGHDSLAPANSAHDLARKIRPYLKNDAPFYSVSMYEQTLPFYIKRTVTLVAYQDEMAFGITQEPGKWIADLETFERTWKNQTYALAIMPPQIYAQLENHLSMQLIARDTRRVVVKTP